MRLPSRSNPSKLFTYTLVSRQQIQQPSFTFNPNSKFRRDYPPRSVSAATMNPSESVKSEPVGLGMWSSPSVPQTVTRPRPATIHETGFSYCMPEEYTSLPAWDSSTMPMQQLHNEQHMHHGGMHSDQHLHHEHQMHPDGLPQTYSVHQDFYPSVGNSESPSAIERMYEISD